MCTQEPTPFLDANQTPLTCRMIPWKLFACFWSHFLTPKSSGNMDFLCEMCCILSPDATSALKSPATLRAGVSWIWMSILFKGLFTTRGGHNCVSPMGWEPHLFPPWENSGADRWRSMSEKSVLVTFNTFGRNYARFFIVCSCRMLVIKQ